MKSVKQLLITSSLSVLLFTACGGGEPAPKANLEQILKISADELKAFETKHSDTTKEKAMGDFALSLADTLNATEPKVYSKTLGVTAEKDGSFIGFHDENVNKLKDSGEAQVFKVEIDGDKQKLIASDSERSAESPFGGMMMGMMMGMLMGNIMGRQRSTGTKPGANTPPRKSAAKSSSSSSKKSSAPSAKSRAGSGSFSSGK
ncbi:MAG TPA: hypothetical protein EYG68_10405 [Leucothrix mucor]|nr:hypothetical protein [Leucothrix mucor]